MGYSYRQKNRPVITYTKYPSPMEHLYYYAKWDGKKWNHLKITNAGNYITIIRSGKELKEAHYSGGVVLDPNNPNYVYLSRKVNGRFELEKLEIKNNNIGSRYPITVNSFVDNVRPFIIKNDMPQETVLMWMSGSYYHYTDYETDLNIRFINRDGAP